MPLKKFVKCNFFGRCLPKSRSLFQSPSLRLLREKPHPLSRLLKFQEEDRQRTRAAVYPSLKYPLSLKAMLFQEKTRYLSNAVASSCYNPNFQNTNSVIKKAVSIYDFYRLSFRAKVGDFVDTFYLSRRINLIFDKVVNVKRDMMTLDDIKKLIENDEI